MEFQQPHRKEKISVHSLINFFLWLVILFCANYIYIEFLFR